MVKSVIHNRAGPYPSPSVNRRELALMILLTLAACALRASDVLGRSLWLDDGVTLLRLSSSWIDNLRNIVYLYDMPTIDTHPPAYFVLLKLWTIFAGYNEFSLKWVSVMAGIVVVPLAYVLGRRLFTPTTALLAAATVTLSPAIQWYSHDIRMYTLVVTL
ncbi:MAG: glycosyltransferase family 39 protein, partial [Anaerolineae bacterium]|nr:glycosyltransferase family 39 protein [Thermoflexales bacterium]MDW8408873.1 glycosyltransferase family 39 protein [Anaerolineae bacterium]